TSAGPWLSPAVVTVKSVPRVLPAMRAFHPGISEKTDYSPPSVPVTVRTARRNQLLYNAATTGQRTCADAAADRGAARRPACADQPDADCRIGAELGRHRFAGYRRRRLAAGGDGSGPAAGSDHPGTRTRRTVKPIFMLCRLQTERMRYI